MSTDVSTWLEPLTKIGLLLLVTMLALLFLLLLRYLVSLIHSLRTKLVVIEVTPPAFSDKPAQATESLFTALHSLGSSRSWVEAVLGFKPRFSVEISSSKKSGIRFYVLCPEDKVETVKQLISSYVPDARVSEESDYLGSRLSRILEFLQKHHYAYPLKSHEELGSSDPIGYITSAMTRLENDEQLSLQIVFRSANLRSADVLRHKILRNESFMPGQSGKGGVAAAVMNGIGSVLFWVADGVSMVYHTDRSNYGVRSAERDLDYKKALARGDRPARTLSYFEHELVESVSEKLKRPLFKTSIRACIVSSNKKRAKSHKKAIASALGLFEVPKYQALKLRLRKVGLSRLILHYQAKRRLVGFSPSPDYYSADELAGLFHFPHSISAKTDNVVKSLSKTLAAPLSLKDGTKLDVLIGENHHHGLTTPIGLTEAERQRHMYVIGGTGNGKTTLLKYQIVQDIQAGKGLAVVDPHGDLAEEILGCIPKERIKDVIHINPDDLSHPVGINLLEFPDGLSGDDLLREKDLVTESTISVLRKIFSDDDSGGHRIEYVLRNTIQTALTVEGANLFTIFRLLNDAKYRKKIVNELEDNDLQIFWKNELGKAGEMQRVKMAAGITSKIGRFLFSASAKRILEQEKSTINFDQAIDDGKIIICNFSKGLLGEDTSMLFGVTILAKLQLAALRRARQKQTERSSYYLYVDEFQNFATMSFVQMLSEARKYKLFLIMAEQSTQQQDDQKLVEVILANVGTVIAFRSGSPKDEELIQRQFRPFVDLGEIANLPAYSFFARISAINTQEPVSGRTVLLDTESDEAIAEKVRILSRKTYGCKVKVKKELKAEKESKPTINKQSSKPKPAKQPTSASSSLPDEIL